MEVTPYVDANGQRVYKIAQVFDLESQRAAYAISLEQQSLNNQYNATKFGNGVISISNLDLPFVKQGDTLDVNDAKLLVDTARRTMGFMLQDLPAMNSMAAADGTNGSLQLGDLNSEFQAYLAEVNRVAHTTTFDGIPLFDGKENSVDVPIHNHSQWLSINLINATIGKRGLNLGSLNLLTQSNSLNALGSLGFAITKAESYLNQLLDSYLQAALVVKG